MTVEKAVAGPTVHELSLAFYENGLRSKNYSEVREVGEKLQRGISFIGEQPWNDSRELSDDELIKRRRYDEGLIAIRNDYQEKVGIAGVLLRQDSPKRKEFIGDWGLVNEALDGAERFEFLTKKQRIERKREIANRLTFLRERTQDVDLINRQADSVSLIEKDAELSEEDIQRVQKEYGQSVLGIYKYVWGKIAKPKSLRGGSFGDACKHGYFPDKKVVRAISGDLEEVNRYVIKVMESFDGEAIMNEVRSRDYDEQYCSDFLKLAEFLGPDLIEMFKEFGLEKEEVMAFL